jgi:hypothetical protein
MLVQRGRDFLKKSVQLATMCDSCKTGDRDKLWNMACTYVQKASELIPKSEFFTLSPLEVQILSSQIPIIPQIEFFEPPENKKDNNSVSQSYVTLQKQIEDLSKQKNELEKANDKLEKYKHLSEKLKEEYQNLEKFQTSYQNRMRDEQRELQSEMKRMLYEIESIPELKRDVDEMETAMNGMRERMKFLCIKHREEMNNMYTEMDTNNLEREVLATNLHYTQQMILTLTQEKQALQVEVSYYQYVFQILWPHLDETHKSLLSDVLSES